MIATEKRVRRVQTAKFWTDQQQEISLKRTEERQPESRKGIGFFEALERMLAFQFETVSTQKD